MQGEASTPVVDGPCKLCPRFTKTFMMLGKKWNGLIIETLLEKDTLRFKDIASSVSKCSDRVLCERLKELEDDQIIVRNTYPGTSRVDYSLTARGRELAPVMNAVHAWSDKWC
ncbi:winged helix-turn-helix transcriptional regulator [Limosilactobacillus kribbianus]|uniref:winged helix-turn-helix transcriptional regulator n=1 Tax=Limosilactobacillus kribbianus TaxID=2982695 RepID=UPI002263DA21|nr:helix-turn-helix domain-containing protein [Limosilactobacillus kribbianus]